MQGQFLGINFVTASIIGAPSIASTKFCLSESGDKTFWDLRNRTALVADGNIHP